ncbi:hypothetical protein ACJJTC_014494 [Scirpophaga incertulas]
MEELRRHIESFQCMESHYTRRDTNKKYLAADLNIRKMYTLYKQLCQKENIEAVNELTYPRVFATEYNLSFFVPKKDQCTICTNYERADKEKKALFQKVYTEHIQRKNKCNAEKEKDKERANDDCNFISVSFDLQAIVQIPHSNIPCMRMRNRISKERYFSILLRVRSMQDWITICQRARRRKIHVFQKKKIVKEPYKTKEFKYHEFYDLKDMASKIILNKDKDNVGNKVQWLKIKRLRYIKGERRIYFNYDMSENFNYMDVTGREGMTRATRAKRYAFEFPIALKKMYKESLPISEAKKKDLLYLIQKDIIPEELGALV